MDGRKGLSNPADRVAAAHAGAASSPEDFGVQLETWRVRMEHALAARLPAATTVPTRLHEAMRYSVLGGGKRIRPALLFATARTLGLTEDEVEAAACAIELIHVYSLVHDDLPAMDDDDLRRGRPTCHKAFDEATAMLVGDALQPLAFQLLARDPSLPASPAIRLALVDTLSVASGTFGMAGGQAIDLAVKGQQPGIAEVEDMHARKTGAVIRASVLMAAQCVPSLEPHLYDALNDFATAIGLAFQIQDDLLDVLGDVSTLGKATGADRERDKPTHPAIIGIEASQDRVHLLHRQALDSLEPFAERAAPLRSSGQLVAVASILSAREGPLRGGIAAWLLLLFANFSPTASEAVEAPAQRSLDVRFLGAVPGATPAPSAVDTATNGSLDAYFEPLPETKTWAGGGTYWLKIQPLEASTSPAAIPVIVIHASRQTRVEVFTAGGAVPLVIALAAFSGSQDRVYAVPAGIQPGQSLYARLEASGAGSRPATVSAATLGETLARGMERARMITLAVGALLSVAAAALLIWFVMAESLFILYATLFFLQALYIGFLSGQAFDWPLLWHARPLTSFAWNVPVGLSGAVACLFTREIADLKDFSPRAYKYYGWFAVLFVALSAANLAKLWGFASLVSAVGNIIFTVAAVFTLAVAFLSWRRGNRAAGWFLIAWTLLEGFTIAAAVHFLATASDQGDGLLYYGLPLSMVAAAVLIALGVADRLSQQRAALSDAERRARTDPLTGVLNRRSLIERLDAGCLRARARGLPVSLLFIDLDHFKLINDSFGHQAGDACLRAIINPIHAELRQSDVIGRYGGEEFVVILSSADAAAAHPIAQRILERVAKVRVEGFGQPIALTCSIGVAASDTLGVWGEQLLNRADAAVYVAKRSGRNQVHMALPSAA